MSELAEYVESMLARHERLSYRRAAIEAGISESLVHKIITGNRRPRLSTLRKLADRWGSSEDYVKMAELAGYDLPDASVIAMASMTFKEVLELVSTLTPDEREQLMVALVKMAHDGRER